jgi:hypothetical protein
MLGDARWFTSTSAGGLHAARWILDGATPVDARLTAAPLAVELAALGADLTAAGIDPAQFFEHALPLAARYNAPAQVAEVALIKIFGPRHVEATQSLVRRLHALWAALRESGFGTLDELELRSRPLREQWEARGPGLLTTLARLTEPDVVVDAADVILVQPALGGGGSAHPLYNAVVIEAVLANPLAPLPEIVRLGWLWGCLNLDLPKFHEHTAHSPLGPVGPLAVIPPLLAAAEEVELVRFDPPLLETALAAWRAPAADPARLWAWWETYRASQPSWAVALTALERLLDDA